jgi:hypothetical protein
VFVLFFEETVFSWSESILSFSKGALSNKRHLTIQMSTVARMHLVDSLTEKKWCILSFLFVGKIYRL